MSSGPSSNQPDAAELSFITILDDKSIKDPARQQQARTQAIKHSLQRKRRQLRQTATNFVDETSATIVRGRKNREKGEDDNENVIELPRRSASLSSSSIDPFDTLIIDPKRLSELLRHGSARQAGEPVFSVNEAIDYQGLKSVFHSGLEDPALSAALCLTLAFAANGGVMDRECSAYRLKCIQLINEKLSDPAQAASTTTVGTILLLVGVEGRLGETETAQIHLNGTKQLLRLCDERRSYLSHAVKRAIFWQDLFTSMITGTQRVLSHETFPEMHWHRDPFQIHSYYIPPGFADRAEILGCEFLDIIADICGLQAMREGDTNYPYDALEVEKIDNQQAWIESRLQQLDQETADPLLSCSIPAAYLCGYGFFAEVWSASIIPSHLAAQLLLRLQQYEAWEGWDDHADLLLWLLNIGAAFATEHRVRLGFAGLWHGSHRARLVPLSSSWEEVREHLKRFIWSEQIYDPLCGSFWNRLQNL